MTYKKIMARRVIIWAFLAVIFWVPVCGAQQWQPLENVVETLGEVTAALYPDADVVKVAQNKWDSYQSDGTYTEYYECYAKVLTLKGQRRYRRLTSSFVIPYNTTRFSLVEIIHPDGSVMSVDIEKNTRVMVEPSQMKSNIYNPNNRVLVLGLPDVRIKDTIHFIIHDVFERARVPGTWSDYVTFEDMDPLILYRYTVIAPEKMPLRSIEIKAPIPGTIESSIIHDKDKTIYTWTAQDVPRAFDEPSMPPLYTVSQRLLVSTIPRWENISSWYWGLCKPHIDQVTPEMKKKVKALTHGLDTPQGRIYAIFQWVSQRIRYLGITVEDTSPGYEPHPASMTFERRAGVCRDKATLLVSMLRIAGVDAFPVLIMNGPEKDPKVPQPFFNHAIVGVLRDNGTYMLMDPTDENTRELFPAYLGGQSFLVARPGGETLKTSPVPTASRNMMRIVSTGVLDKDNTLEWKTTLEFAGINDNAYRGYFARHTDQQRRAFFEKMVARVAPGATMTGYRLFPEDMMDMSRPLKAVIDFEIESFPVCGKGIGMLPVPFFARSVGMVNFICKDTGLNKRKYPLETGFPCGVQEEWSMDLSGFTGRIKTLPLCEDIKNKGSQWTNTIVLKGDLLTGERVFKLKQKKYTPENYLLLKKTLAAIEKDTSKMPVFSMPPPWYAQYNGDAVVLDDFIECDIADAHTWIRTRHRRIKVLSYAGKKGLSDIHIKYNPSWELVEVKDARVISPDGEVQEIQATQINLMDAQWAGDAPRYPASKTLVVSLPGVEKGSIIDYTIVSHKENRSFFSLQEPMKGFEPIEKKRVVIRVPEGMELHMEALHADGDDAVKTKVSHAKGLDEYSFEVSRMPPVTKEEDLPPIETFNPVILISSGDWDSYAERMSAVLEDAASVRAKAGKKAQGLVAGLDNDTMQICAIRDYVDTHIRPVDTGINAMPLSFVSPADTTLMDGYGNAIDRAVLLYAMLDAVGLDPGFVLVTGKPSIEPVWAYPSPGWFDDVLVHIQASGSMVFLNDTDQYARLGVTAHDLCFGMFLEGPIFKEILASSDLLRDGVKTCFDVRLSGRGDARISCTKKYFGNECAAFVKETREMTPEERDRHYQGLVTSLSQRAVPVGGYETDTLSYPATSHFCVDIKEYAVLQGDTFYMEIPGLIGDCIPAETKKRDWPLYIDAVMKKDTLVEVHLPANCSGIKIAPPHRYRIALNGSAVFKMETEQKGDIVKVTQHLDLGPCIVKPNDYPGFLILKVFLSSPSTGMLLLDMKK
ncbi:MAG: DUF3857 domain-containing protein [Thermodesulfobacteriota bacterium]|nr:DUF3857 domain-containing protein [Thermodesulfobacteriota bacterium]